MYDQVTLFRTFTLMYSQTLITGSNFLVRVRVMVFNTTFNNISAISWWSVSLVEETEVPRENHRPVASHCEIISRNVVRSTPHQYMYMYLNYNAYFMYLVQMYLNYNVYFMYLVQMYLNYNAYFMFLVQMYLNYNVYFMYLVQRT
jgi:hypothetical protein